MSRLHYASLTTNLADASDPSLERVGVRRGASGRMHTPGARWPTYTCTLHSDGYLSDSYASTNERLNFELIYQRCAIHVEIQTSMFPCLICPFRIFFLRRKLQRSIKGWASSGPFVFIFFCSPRLHMIRIYGQPAKCERARPRRVQVS